MDEFRFDAGTVAASFTTPDGWERVYLRLARPNWNYKYFNQDGTSRIEVISPDDLFDKRSTDTAKMIPLGIGHPVMKRVDSFNVDHYMKGSTGHTVLREKTADGEFLGITATIFSESGKQAAKRFPGISPGYGVRLARSDGFNDGDTRLYQKERSYNHGALGVIPRGGAEVRAVFEGLRVDEAEGPDNSIWVASFNADCYAAPVDEEFVAPLLERRDAIEGVAEKSQVNLDRYTLLKADAEDDEDDDEEGGEEKGDRKSESGLEFGDMRNRKKRKRNPKPMGFGKQFQPQRKDAKSMTTTSFELDGVTYQEVPIAFAQAIAPIIKRVDGVVKQLEGFQERVDGLKEELTAAQERADSLDGELKTAKARVDELEAERTDEKEDREDAAEDAVKLALDIAATVDQMRADGLMLQQLGLVENFNTDFAHIAENMGELQREMLGVAYPDQRTDGYSDRDTAIAYDTAMGAIRAFAAQQQDRTDEGGDGDPGENREDMYYPDMGIGRNGMGYRKPMLNAGLPTLHKVGQMSRPMKPTATTVRSLLRRFEKAEEAVFDEASKQSGPMLHHPMTAKIM